jgi:site-specific DNA-cytosine methylase
MKINQLDLFSGIGGFHLGFERAGYEVTSFFSEVDKHAIAVYKHQFPNSTYVGSVTDVRGADLPTIDPYHFWKSLPRFQHWLENVLGMEGDRRSSLSSKQFASLGNADQVYLSGKMLKEHSAAT